jgi:TctA family transporter
MTEQPELFWGVIASFFVGNIILLLINIPLIRLWVLLLRIPYQKLYPVIIVMICVGVYSHRTSVTDVMLTLAFGVLGYLMKSYRFEPAPVLLGFVLGPLLEDNFRRAMLIYRGDFTVFVTRPISAILVACSVALIAFAIWSGLRARRRAVRASP